MVAEDELHELKKSISAQKQKEFLTRKQKEEHFVNGMLHSCNLETS